MQLSLPRMSATQPRAVVVIAACAAAVVLALGYQPGAAAAKTPKPNTTRISVTTGGFHPGHGSNHRVRASERRTVSANGRFVVFEGYSPLVKGQKQLENQIVLRDRKLGTTTLVSKSSKGKKANASSYNPQISANGRWIAFDSNASNLVPRDTNGVRDVFLHDTKTGKTTRVSVDSAGKQVTSTYGSTAPSLSANGRYVTFGSDAEGLAPGDMKRGQAYIHDRVSKKTELVSVDSDGFAMYSMDFTSVSADGNVVAFVSLHRNSNPLMYVRDRKAGTTRSYMPDDLHRVYSPSISSDGRYIAMRTNAALDPNDTNKTDDVYVLDRTTGKHTLASKSSAGRVGNGKSLHPTISANGRYVVFESVASNLVAKDSNKRDDVFRHDLRTGETVRVSVRNNGKQIAASSNVGSINAHGNHVVFESYGSNVTKLTAGSWAQVYARSFDKKFPALTAKTTKFASKVRPGKTLTIKTTGIAKGQRLVVKLKPRGKTQGKTVTRNVKVKKNRIKVKAPRSGTYTLTVTYDRFQLAKKKLTVR